MVLNNNETFKKKHCNGFVNHKYIFKVVHYVLSSGLACPFKLSVLLSCSLHSVLLPHVVAYLPFTFPCFFTLPRTSLSLGLSVSFLGAILFRKMNKIRRAHV